MEKDCILTAGESGPETSEPSRGLCAFQDRPGEASAGWGACSPGSAFSGRSPPPPPPPSTGSLRSSRGTELLVSACLSRVVAVLRRCSAVRDVTPSLRPEPWFLDCARVPDAAHSDPPDYRFRFSICPWSLRGSVSQAGGCEPHGGSWLRSLERWGSGRDDGPPSHLAGLGRLGPSLLGPHGSRPRPSPRAPVRPLPALGAPPLPPWPLTWRLAVCGGLQTRPAVPAVRPHLTSPIPSPRLSPLRLGGQPHLVKVSF